MLLRTDNGDWTFAETLTVAMASVIVILVITALALRYIHTNIDHDAEEDFRKADKLFEKCCNEEYRTAFSCCQSEKERKKILVKKRKEKMKHLEGCRLADALASSHSGMPSNAGDCYCEKKFSTLMKEHS